MTETRTDAKRPRPTRASSSRRVAYDIIAAVRESDAYANLLLPARLAEAGLDAADSALATELTYGTLRGLGRYDRVIELAAGRPTHKIDVEVLDVLRLGVHQLLSTRIPPHAAVDESVQLVVALGRRSASGFVNGVLRSIARKPPETWLAESVEGLTGEARLAMEHSHPRWIVEAFRAALSAEGRADELDELLHADNVPPAVSLVALPGLAEPADVGRAGTVSPVAVRSPGGDPRALPLVASGRVRVQDEGSQLAALALSRARPIRAGERWLDLCAGPGGKAALLAAEALRGGAELTANELIPARAGLVRNALAVFEAPPVVLEGDGARFGTGDGAQAPGRYDRILLDAPCTGLGALRRRPEARWRKQPGDLAELTPLQGRLLDAAIDALAPGGILAYVTCSPHLAETREAVEAALTRHPALRTVDTGEVVSRIATSDLELPDGTAVQLWPHRHGTDAMFIQLLTTLDS